MKSEQCKRDCKRYSVVARASAAETHSWCTFDADGEPSLLPLSDRGLAMPLGSKAHTACLSDLMSVLDWLHGVQ